MKTLIVLIGGICILSTNAKAQNASKSQTKIEKKNVVLKKKDPIKLQSTSANSFKSTSKKREEKPVTIKQTAIEPKK